MVPDNYVSQLVEDRLNMTDCKVSGWVMDNYPVNEPQVIHLKKLKIKPSVVCIFDQSADVSVSRLQYLRIDPVTGDKYDLLRSPPETDEVLNRLETLKKYDPAMIR